MDKSETEEVGSTATENYMAEMNIPMFLNYQCFLKAYNNRNPWKGNVSRKSIWQKW